MASYASIVENVPEYINPINFDLLGKVMGAKQARFDQNLAQTEQVMAELKLQENLLLRDEDKQAFVSKVQGLVILYIPQILFIFYLVFICFIVKFVV